MREIQMGLFHHPAAASTTASTHSSGAIRAAGCGAQTTRLPRQWWMSTTEATTGVHHAVVNRLDLRWVVAEFNGASLYIRMQCGLRREKECCSHGEVVVRSMSVLH